MGMSAFMAEYELGEMVYLRTDEDQRRWIVAGIEFRLDGGVLHRLIHGTLESWHSALELSRERCVAEA